MPTEGWKEGIQRRGNTARTKRMWSNSQETRKKKVVMENRAMKEGKKEGGKGHKKDRLVRHKKQQCTNCSGSQTCIISSNWLIIWIVSFMHQRQVTQPPLTTLSSVQKCRLCCFNKVRQSKSSIWTEALTQKGLRWSQEKIWKSQGDVSN